ncbi:hypothetical protein KAJ61_02635 [Candidatus Parcubacteria bacterium]|nr:hypothetical protein [Candidatus Parcubacteria bacterium]
MQKIKRFKIAIVAVLILSMMAIYGSVPNVEADSLDLAKDTISDSSPGQTGVTHTIVYDLGIALGENQYVRFTFESGIDLSAATTTCPLNTTASATAQLIDCVVDAGEALASTTATSTIITDAANPSTTGDYSVTISTHESDGTEIESSEVKIYIIDEVTVTAHVEATLSFSIATTTPHDSVGGESFTSTSSPTALAFGALVANTEYLMGHLLTVATNADDGYTVTVQQDDDLENGAGAIIDGYSTSSSALWPNPITTDINDETTWGYFGLTSDDSDVSATSSKYQGFDGTDAFTIMTHDGPANNEGVGIGTTTVGYKIEVSALQEAGDYQNALTYICTPIY